MSTRPSTRRAVAVTVAAILGLALAMPAAAQERKPDKKSSAESQRIKPVSQPRPVQRRAEPAPARPADRPAIERRSTRPEPRIERRSEREPEPVRKREIRDPASPAADRPDRTPRTTAWRADDGRIDRIPASRELETAGETRPARSGFFHLPAPADRSAIGPADGRPGTDSGEPDDRRELRPLPPDPGEDEPAPGEPISAPKPGRPPVSEPPATLPPVDRQPSDEQPAPAYPGYVDPGAWRWGWGWGSGWRLGWGSSLDSFYKFGGECVDPFRFRDYDPMQGRHWIVGNTARRSGHGSWFFIDQSLGCYDMRDRAMSFENSLGGRIDTCADVIIEFADRLGYRFAVELPALEARNIEEFARAIEERFERGETVHLWTTDGTEVRLHPGTFDTLRIQRCGEA